MDLNYLFHRHQVSLFRSENAACAKSRAAHLGLTEGYASRIDAAKRAQRPLDAAGLPAIEAVSAGGAIA